MAVTNLLEVFTNNPAGTVTAGGTTTSSQGSVETWTVSVAAAFPVALANATQFHVADTALPGEIFAVTVAPGGTGSQTWTVTRGSEGSTTVAHTAGFTVVQVVTAGGLSLAATASYQFNVQAYGAKGDGQCVMDGAMSSSTNTTTLTCATSLPFKAADVGKNIMVVGAASVTPNITTLVGTITGYTSPGVVTISAACQTTGSGFAVLWASDDTAAFQAAINAAVAWAQANLCDVIVTVPDAPGQFWGIGGALVTGGTTHGNAQLTLPVIAVTSQKVALTIQGIGTVPGGTGQYHWQQPAPQFNGSTLVSFGIFQTASAMNTSASTYGFPCVIGGPSPPQGGYGNLVSGNCLFSNMVIVLDGLVIMTTLSLDALNYCGCDFYGVSQANIIDCNITAATTYLTTWGAGKSMSASGYSFGACLPAAGNNDNNVIDRLGISGGFRWGLIATEHTVIHRVMILYCYAGLCPAGAWQGSVGAYHSIFVDQLSVEGCNYLVEVLGAAGSAQPLKYDIMQFDTEGAGLFTDDGNNGILWSIGKILFSGLVNPTSMVIGPTQLEIINNAVPPGFPAAAWVLVAGTAFQNPGWRWANVTLYGGATVTAVSLGVTRGGSVAPTMTSVYTQSSGVLPPLMVRVPPGGWIKVTCGTIPSSTVVYD